MQSKNVCNRCGRELDLFDTQQGFAVRAKLGYGSIYDGEWVNYQLCCDCIDKVIAESAVSPVEGH